MPKSDFKNVALQLLTTLVLVGLKMNGPVIDEKSYLKT